MVGDAQNTVRGVLHTSSVQMVTQTVVLSQTIQETHCSLPCETFLGSIVNEKIAQFYVTVKKRTEVVSPSPSIPRIVTMVRREREEEKRERGHRVTCVISLKKLDNLPRLQLVNLPTFRLGVLFPKTREHYNGRISCIVSITV
ncbi:hypothetical protein TNCV_4039581 [Trichonephila clavipes]|nr:hypothetical protein TNCV_4039581 [Trichonephila clavipes]